MIRFEIPALFSFFKLLFNRELSHTFQKMLDGHDQPKLESPVRSTAAAKPQPQPGPVRSEAISLLAALQREARLLDIVNESLDEYTDAQVGAAARDVLRDSGKTIERMFGLVPLTELEDGSPLETPAAFDPAEFRLTGNVVGEAPFRGFVAHHGWKATRCDVPNWSGKKSSAMIVAPVELEIR